MLVSSSYPRATSVAARIARAPRETIGVVGERGYTNAGDFRVFGIVRGVADPLAQTVAFDAATLADSAAPAVLSQAASSGPADSGPKVIAGRYEVLGLLGAGGMGNVYRARDRELDEVVALKVLRPEIAGNAAALERFRREVKLARRVTHPNVARVFDIGDQGGEKYLTMELVDGEPLGAVLARAGKWGAKRAIEVGAQVCAGLAAAHAAGVVHRDLKPDNVLLAKDGRVVVTDFGIARAVASADANITGAVIGTPAYMAPEQVEGRVADARADIYALGAMLYEILTGDAPWQGDNVFAVAAARLLNAPPEVRAKRPDLPEELSAIVARCMARSPDERFASVEEIALALSRVQLAAAPVPSIAPASPRSIGAAVLPPSAPMKKQVAVLPFRNAGAREHEHIAEGLTEELIDLLCLAKDLRVRSRGTVARYRGGDRDPREIGRELDVPVVVEGSVRKEGGLVRVSVRLVSVADGVQIWHRRFDRPENEIFAVSDAAARAIAQALAVEIVAPARSAPDNAEAIDLYLRARSLYLQFFSDLKGESIELFERALALAPEDPRILAGYAMAACRRYAAGAERADRAREAARRAVERAPNLADSHVAYAMVLYHDQRETEVVGSLAKALRLSRMNAEAHDMIGRLLAETQLQDAARKHLETALTLEPDLHLSRAMLARLHMLHGRWDAADTVAEGALLRSGTVLPSTARMCLWRRDSERAKRLLADESLADELSWGLSRVLLDLAAHGIPPYDRAPSPVDPTSRFYLFLRQLEVESAIFLGDPERALSALTACAEGGVFDVAWADMCPLFEPIRKDPRFVDARDRIAARAKRIEEAYLAAT